MSDQLLGRSARLDRALAVLLQQAPELEAAAVVSFDGLAMASSLPEGMDEDRVAAMSAALLSLGEKAAQGLGRGDLSQVYVEGESGTVFLISCDDEAVLVAVAAAGAKAGLMLFEVRRAATDIAAVLRHVSPVAEAEADVDAAETVDAAALAGAEAAYAAYRAAEAARVAAVPAVEAIRFDPYVTEPRTSPMLLPSDWPPQDSFPPLTAAFLPEPLPLVEPAVEQPPTPEITLAPWESPPQREGTWS